MKECPNSMKIWKTKNGLDAVIILNHCPPPMNSFFCGYVGVPKTSNFFKKDYRDTQEVEDMNIHGGITFSAFASPKWPPSAAKLSPNLYWFGFDCAHSDDTLKTCNLEFCINECEKLAAQLQTTKEQ